MFWYLLLFPLREKAEGEEADWSQHCLNVYSSILLFFFATCSSALRLDLCFGRLMRRSHREHLLFTAPQVVALASLRLQVTPPRLCRRSRPLIIHARIPCLFCFLLSLPRVVTHRRHILTFSCDPAQSPQAHGKAGSNNLMRQMNITRERRDIHKVFC